MFIVLRFITPFPNTGCRVGVSQAFPTYSHNKISKPSDSCEMFLIYCKQKYKWPVNMYKLIICHARRIPVRPDWRIRTEVQGAILSILYTGTLIDLFFLRAELVPVGIQTISVIKKNHFTYTKELPPEWCPSQSIHIY